MPAWGKMVQGVHIGGADDAEDVGDAVGDKSFHQRFAGSHLNGHDVRGPFAVFWESEGKCARLEAVQLRELRIVNLSG